MDSCGFGSLLSLAKYSVRFSSVFLLSFNDAPCRAPNCGCARGERREWYWVHSESNLASCEIKVYVLPAQLQGLTFALNPFWKRDIIIEISWSKIRHQRVHPTHLYGFVSALTKTHGMCFFVSIRCFCFHFYYLSIFHPSCKHLINIFRDIDLVCML